MGKRLEEVSILALHVILIFIEFTNRFFQSELQPDSIRGPVHPSACLSVPVSLWRGFVDKITSTIVGEYRRVFYNYPGPKNEQCHTQTV